MSYRCVCVLAVMFSVAGHGSQSSAADRFKRPITLKKFHSGIQGIGARFKESQITAQTQQGFEALRNTIAAESFECPVEFAGDDQGRDLARRDSESPNRARVSLPSDNIHPTTTDRGADCIVRRVGQSGRGGDHQSGIATDIPGETAISPSRTTQ